jgi:hypothetical protein
MSARSKKESGRREEKDLRERETYKKSSFLRRSRWEWGGWWGSERVEEAPGIQAESLSAFSTSSENTGQRFVNPERTDSLSSFSVTRALCDDVPISESHLPRRAEGDELGNPG